MFIKCCSVVLTYLLTYKLTNLILLFNPLNAELNPICHLLALLGAHHILHISGIRVNPLTPNDRYSGRTAPLTSKRFILYIYSTNISTEYFKHGVYSSFISLENAVCFIILTYLVPVLFTFYIFIQQI